MRIRVVSEVQIRVRIRFFMELRSDPGRVYPGQNLGLRVSIIVKVVVILNGKFMFSKMYCGTVESGKPYVNNYIDLNNPRDV